GSPPLSLKTRSVNEPPRPPPATCVPHQRNNPMLLLVLATQLSACWPPLISAGNESPLPNIGGWLYTVTSAAALSEIPANPINATAARPTNASLRMTFLLQAGRRNPQPPSNRADA